MPDNKVYEIDSQSSGPQPLSDIDDFIFREEDQVASSR